LLLIHKAREENLRKFIACFVVATFFVAFAPALATAPPERVQVIIVFKERPNADLITGLGGEVITTYNIIPGLAARVPIGALEELRKNPAIAYIEPDAIVYALEQQVPWGINRIGAPSAWSSSTGAEVKVAILDTGIQHDHPDLVANVKGGISVVGKTDSTDPVDWNDGDGHGTHVAGIVAAVNNDVGVVGSAPDAWLYGVKVLFDNGEGYVSDVIDGIDWSVQNGMQVLNMSLGTTSDISAFEDACDQAYEAGLLLVAAAGNEGDGNPDTTELSYPAAYDSVIAVAATDSNDQAPSWSNSGPFVELAAPGVGVLSTDKDNDYSTKWGTSMAAPHVSGTAALVWASNPSLTNVQVRSILQQTAEDLGPAGRDTVYGYGLVRADEAVQTNVLTLRPDANGEYTEYTTVFGTAEHWDTVNDVAPDEDNTYIETATAGHRDTFNLENSELPDVPILNVRVHARARKTRAAATKINLMIRTYDNDHLSEDMTLTSSYATYYKDWAVNPHTGGSWTVSEVDALQAGVRSASPKNHRVTQVYVDITYKVPTHGGEVAQVTSVPDYVYLTWASADTAHTINVSWRTDGNYVGEVCYDNVSRGGDPDAYSYSAGGTGGLTTPELQGYIHHVELTGLDPDTIYYFICGNSDYGWSNEYSFCAAPDQRTNFRFATGGDSRDDDRYDYTQWPSARDDVSKEMAEHNPSFVLFLGDYLWSSEDPGPGYAENDTWDNWLGAAFKYWRTDDNRLIPQIPVIGNHEIVYPEPSDYDPETEATNYYTVFNLPGNERWYALNWGPDLRIIVLDSEVINEDSYTWQEQLEWLEGELQKSENYLWKMVAYHRPIFRFWEPHEQRRLADWGYLFTKYGVDVAFQAHIHWYERSHPIDSDPPPGEIAPSPGEGVIYLTSGGWGGPLSYGGPEWYTAYGPESDYHFTLVDVFENGTLHLQAIDRWGNVFDEFFLQKDIFDISISPSENEGLPGKEVTFLVTVKNTGGTTDNYLLENVDNAGWILKLDNDRFYNVAPGESRTTTLTVTIPGGATPCTEDNITVVATSQKNIEISDNATCIAHVVSLRVEFSLVTLYKISLNVNLYLENGSKLVAKFYTYGDAYENESVIENFIPPAHVVKLENVPHPGGLGIKKVRLDLTTDNTEDVISTLATFTVTRSILMGRVVEIYVNEWPFASPEERSALMSEVVDIYVKAWSFAPV